MPYARHLSKIIPKALVFWDTLYRLPLKVTIFSVMADKSMNKERCTIYSKVKS